MISTHGSPLPSSLLHRTYGNEREREGGEGGRERERE
jgi:hypothetical protein